MISICSLYIDLERLLTTNMGETGAFSASATSCTFALTLAFLVLIVLKASVKLFCLLCLPPVLACPFQAEPRSPLSLLGCHLSADADPLMKPFDLVGLDGYGDCPSRGSM